MNDSNQFDIATKNDTKFGVQVNLSVTFFSGVGSVTGANFLLQDSKTKILVDCGLLQGTTDSYTTNGKEFPYNPSEMDYLFLTHAHLDHIGRIPKLVKDGFKGVIYSTPPTKIRVP